MDAAFAEKVSIVTGAASGIGRACAEALYQRGSRVVLVDVSQAGLDSAAEAFAQGGGRERILTLRLDVSSEADMQRMAAATLEAFGRIDHLVAAAGIARMGEGLRTLADTSYEEWRKVLDVNLTGTFLSNRAVLPAMIAQKRGDIVNVSSTSGRQGRPYDGPYCASKFGIIGLSEALSEEVSTQGVRVQTLLPDAVETPFWDQGGPLALKPVHMLPVARVAEFVCFLLSLPEDTILVNPVLAPMKTRKRKGKGG